MNIETIPAKSISNYVNKPGCIIVDLRTKEDYMNGHVPSAVNIYYEEIAYQIAYLSQFHEVVLYCARGNLSLLAARSLNIPSTHILNVYGGIHAYRGELVRGKNNI